MKNKLFRKFFAFLAIAVMVFSNASFYALTGLIDSYERGSGIVDKIWLLQSKQRDDVVDNFSSIRNIAKKLQVLEAMAAVTYQTNSAVVYSASGGTSIAPAYPTGVVANDLLVLTIGMKPSAANGGSVTTPAGWTPIVSLTGAGGYGTTLGADTGNTNIFSFYKVAVGGETGTLAITLAGNGVSWARMYRLSAAVGSTWSVAGSTGSDITTGAAVSIANSTNPGVTAGDYIIGAMVIPTDVTTPAQFSAEALTQTGVTFSAVTEIGEADSTTGNDIGGVMYRASVTAGTATGNPTFTATAAGTVTNVRGPGAFIRIREIPAANTTSISNFVSAEPGDSTIAPGASALVDSFGLATNAGTDTVTGVTVGLAAGTGARINTVAITNDADTVTYCSVAPSGDTATLAGCGIPVTTTNTQFKVKITAIAHASMPVPPGGSYAVTATVASWVGTNATHAGTDSGSSIITIDNASPNNATAVSGTAGNAANTVNWTASNSADFDTTNGSVIYRWAAGSAGAEVPAEGSSPAIGGTNGAATVACVVSSAASAALSRVDGTGGSAECTNVALTNGQVYTYKVFQQDTNGNFDVGVLIGSFTPTAPLSLAIAATAGNQITNLNSGDVSKFINDTTCTTEANCSAFKLTASGGAVTVTSIKVSETGSVVANIDLSNPTLIYDTDANYANGTTGTFGTAAAFAADQTVNFSNAGLVIPNGSTYYFYLRSDMKSGTPTYPAGGQTIDFQITNTADVVTSGTPIKSGAPAILTGTTTVRPQILNYTNSTESGLNYAAACTNCGARLGSALASSQSLVISGYGFGSDPGLGSRDTATNKIEIVGAATDALIDDGSANTNVTVWSNTSITIRTNGALAGNTDSDWGTNFGGAAALKVTAGSQAVPTNLNFYLFPQVTSLTVPTAVADAAREYDAGDTDGVVTLNGTRFGTAQTGGWVRILGCDSTTCSGPTGSVAINSWSNTAIAVQVPAVIADNVYTGSLLMQQGQGSSNKAHTYTNSGFRILPRITSISPISGSVGDSVTVNGNHLCQNGGTCPVSFDINNKLTFSSNVNATALTSWSNTAIVATVPVGSVTGGVFVTSNSAYVSNTENFTILSPTPSDPASLNQFRDSGLTQPLSVGDFSSSTNIYLSMTMSTGVSGGMLYPQIEYQPIGTSFTCVGNGGCAQATEGIGKSGPGPVDCSQTANGCAITITPSDNVYHWQARVRHVKGGIDYYSNWVSFGGNGEAATDFAIDHSGPVITFPGAGTCNDAVSSLSSNEATISWTSTEQGTGQVEYSKNADLSGSVFFPIPVSPLAYSQAINIFNLDSNSTYYFKVKSVDGQGNSVSKPSTSPYCSFTTTNVTQPAKTVSFYVAGLTNAVNAGIVATTSFSVYLPETSVSIKSAFLELTGISEPSGTNNLELEINSIPASIKTYQIDSGNSSFKLLYPLNSGWLNVDPLANELSITPSLSTSVISGKIFITYSFAP